MENAILFAPELVCAIMGFVLFLSPIFGWSYRTTFGIALLSGLFVLIASVYTLPFSGEPFYPGIYRVDFFSQLMKLALSLGFLLTILASRTPHTLHASGWVEYPMFLIFSTLGMMMMVSATELITLYLAMEFTAYPIYIIVALHRNVRVGGESATKYMIQGMAASAVSLYGMSFLFGVFGSPYFKDITPQLAIVAGQPIFWLGLLLTLGGFLFKLGAFPFHFWAPDTYQTAPHGVVTFIATVSKVAAVAILCRLLALLLPSAWASSNLQPVLMWMSVIAMTLGNLSALVQRDFKRLLGYSTVAHAGYMLIGLQSFGEQGLTAALFYGIGYFVMNFACFLVVCEVNKNDDLVTIESMAGLYKRSPLLAMALLIGLFGLIGLPPTVGFIGKWLLFSAALSRGQFYLVLIAAINATIGLYYYLMVIRQVYWAEPTSSEAIRPHPLVAIAAVASIVIVLVMGTFPGIFWDMAARAAAALIS